MHVLCHKVSTHAFLPHLPPFLCPHSPPFLSFFCGSGNKKFGKGTVTRISLKGVLLYIVKFWKSYPDYFEIYSWRRISKVSYSWIFKFEVTIFSWFEIHYIFSNSVRYEKKNLKVPAVPYIFTFCSCRSKYRHNFPVFPSAAQYSYWQSYQMNIGSYHNLPSWHGSYCPLPSWHESYCHLASWHESYCPLPSWHESYCHLASWHESYCPLLPNMKDIVPYLPDMNVIVPCLPDKKVIVTCFLTWKLLCPLPSWHGSYHSLPS